jgi:hypothetical protein
MSNYLYHNKFHLSLHHTVSSAGYPDSATDPIAGIGNEFLGTFYNAVCGVTTTSTEWRSNYLQIKPLSGGWEKYKTTYSTVCSLSAPWNLGYSFRTEYFTNSADYESTDSNLASNSAYWFNLYNAFTKGDPQQYTKQISFSGVELVQTVGNIDWDLDVAQVAFINLSLPTVTLRNPTNMKKGGCYTLIIRQDQAGSKSVAFEANYVLNIGNPGVMLAPFGVTVIRFISNGTRLFGKVTQYYYGLGSYYTYLDDGGVGLAPDPSGLNAGASFVPGNGMTVAGAAPYDSGDGLTIIEVVP